MWDPSVAAGTVPHQNIGYLFPMGPYYWLAERIGLPDWVAQRLWIGLASMAAAVGVHWLLRTLDPSGIDLGSGAPPGRRRGLPAQPLPAALRVAALRAPRGVGRAALAVRPDGASAARRRLAMAGVVRRGAGPGREHQRQLARVRAPRTAHLARVGARHPAKRSRPGSRCRPQARAAQHRRVAVVGRRPPDPGRLRHRRPALHRVPRHRRRHLHRPGERPPARLLVLLRQRAGLPLHPAVGRLPGAPWLLVAGFAIPTLALAAATFTRWRYRGAAPWCSSPSG